MLYLTDNAKKRVRAWVQKENKKAIRIEFKKSGGCAGIMYEVTLDDNFNVAKDFAVKFDGFDVLIEHDYFYSISGATLDFVTDEKTLSSQFLIVDNPNEKSRCGCGESFSV